MASKPTTEQEVAYIRTLLSKLQSEYESSLEASITHGLALERRIEDLEDRVITLEHEVHQLQCMLLEPEAQA